MNKATHFDQLIDRKNTSSMKWECANRMYPNLQHEVLPLWVADMDFSVPTPIKNAMKAKIDHGIFGYSYIDDEYCNIVRNWFLRKFNWSFNNEDIFFSPGIVPALSLLIRALTKEEDAILIQTPVYYPFYNVIRDNNRKVIRNTLIKNDNNHYQIDIKDFEQQIIDHQVKAFILCHPHNPVGRMWTFDELKSMLDVCKKHNVIIISDEIHSDIRRNGIEHIPIATIDETMDQQIITCTAPSKTFNLAGLNASNIIIKNKTFQKLWTNKTAVFANPSPVALEAIKAAYTECDEWLDALNQYLDANLEYLKQFVDQNLPYVKYEIPEATYLAWLDFSGTGLSDQQITDIILNEAAVAFDEGKVFGEEGLCFQRINVACPRTTLENALQLVKKAFDKHL